MQFGKVFTLALIGVMACNARDRSNGEQAFVEHEVSELKAALAKRSETGVLVGCSSTTANLATVSKPLAEQIEQLCYIEAPRLYLENAVADARKRKAEHPDLGDLACMQLLASDAFKAIAAHPSTDPGLRALADEYTKLCPDQVAKFPKR